MGVGNPLDRGLDRRTWLVGVGAATVAVGAGLGCDSADGNAQGGKLPPEAVALMGDLRPGVAVERWQIEAVHPVRHGALPVVLSSADGRRYQVDVLARDPKGPQGVANTSALSLFVANRGDGGTPTDEDQGLGAMALARALAPRESAGAKLLGTFTQRAAAHPDGSFAVPLG